MLRDQAEVTSVIEQAPAPNGACWYAALRECDDKRRARFHHTPSLANDFAWPRQMLYRNADGCAIEFAGSKWQRRILVEILGVPIIEKGIFRQFASVGADSDDSRKRDFWRKVTHPAGHQIKNGPSGWESFTIEIGDGGDRSGVDFARGHWLCAGEHIEVRCSGHRKERQFPLSNLFGVK